MRNQGGFTLIELMIVVIVIAILAAVAIPNYGAALDRAKNAAVQEGVHSLQKAIEAYHTDHYDAYPDHFSVVLTDPGNPMGTGYPRTAWGFQQAPDADIDVPGAAVGSSLGPGFARAPVSFNDYGAICYEASGSATESYAISGIGKQGDNAVHLCKTVNQ